MPSQCIHLDHCYNSDDLALPVEMIISLSVTLVKPCIILMVFHVYCSDSTFKSRCQCPSGNIHYQNGEVLNDSMYDLFG